MAVVAALAALLTACGNPPRPPEPNVNPPPRLAATFDLQAHRGGMALTTENTLEAFGRALDLGVTTLVLETQVTKDGEVVVAQGPSVSPDLCRDTRPASADEALHPYVGKRFRDLTLEQVRTLDCAVARHPDFEDQRLAEDGRVPLLREVIALARERGADIGFDVEITTRADDPQATVPRADFVRAVWAVVGAEGIAQRVTVRSLDWSSLVEFHRVAPAVPLAAMASSAHLEVGEPGASPWLAGLDVDDVGGDVVKAVGGVAGVRVLAPDAGLVDMDLMRRAHAAGLLVVPWTVDDAPVMKHLVELGVDGLTTNRPDVLRTVLSDSGLPMPAQHHAAG